jgi:hypothetical protein
MIGLAAALALLGIQSDRTEPLPPPVFIAPPTPQAPTIGSRTREPIVPSRMDVRVTAGRDLLWEGSLRVGLIGGLYRQDLTQAPAVPCLPGSRDSQQTRSGFVVSINRVPYGNLSNQHQVTINWSRPSETPSCTGSGARTVELRETISLDTGEEVTLEGDAGLAVRIRRAD